MFANISITNIVKIISINTSKTVKPSDSFKVVAPQKLAGILKLPAKSPPIPNALPPETNNAHSPPDEPPGVLK